MGIMPAMPGGAVCSNEKTLLTFWGLLVGLSPLHSCLLAV